MDRPLAPARRAGVLLMAHGAAAALEEIPEYLRAVLGGRPLPPGLVEEVTERYRRMGGRSPLLDITRAQAEALERRLNDGGAGFSVLVGMRHSRPTLRAAVERAVAEGLSPVVALPLTPYHSSRSVGAYRAALEEAAAGSGLELRPPGDWHAHPGLVRAYAARIREALARVPDGLREETVLLLTAHSLPRRVVDQGDLYPAQVRETAEAAAREAGAREWRLAYQSRGAASAEPWLGPDAGEVLEELARAGRRSVLLAPIGFVSEHMETLYDGDVLYREQAARLGLAYERAAALNDMPAFIDVLADVARKALR